MWRLPIIAVSPFFLDSDKSPNHRFIVCPTTNQPVKNRKTKEMAKTKKVAKAVVPHSPAKKATPVAALVGGYHALALPLARGALFRRFLYVKAHVAKSLEGGSELLLAPERSAYVVNVPSTVVDVEAWLRARLEPAAGAVQHVVVAAAPADSADPLLARSAHVAFKSADALKKLLALQELPEPKNEVENENGSQDDTRGLQKYLRQYRANKPGLAAVKALADQYMAMFDAEEDAVRVVFDWVVVVCN